MAKKRKSKKQLFPCLHCTEPFYLPIRWCLSCEAHVGDSSWTKTERESCDRCSEGLNDDYIKRKKGKLRRIEAAMKKAEDPVNWSTDGVAEAFDKWVLSPEYKDRFGEGRKLPEQHNEGLF